MAKSKATITFQGLTELLKACEDCASDAELADRNRRIVDKAKPIVKEAMQRKIPVSPDNGKSGRAGCRPDGHARPNVPVGKTKVSGAVAAAEVGWQLSDNSEYFYMKFVNWGTIRQKPKEFIRAAIQETERPVTEIARKEYEAMLAAKFGG